ncbi:metal ion binding protein [Salix suchowensis]|nr:metal ion binding protein [Salix suchowensis]
MGRQSCDPAIIHSSIALLQERFRQLERAKEIRQQRELLKLFSEADHVQSAMACESSKLLHSELTLPPRQPIQASLSFQPTLQTEHNDLKAPIVANLCSTDSVMNLRYNFDESDVDTSLHL